MTCTVSNIIQYYAPISNKYYNGLQLFKNISVKNGLIKNNIKNLNTAKHASSVYMVRVKLFLAG